MYEYICDMVCMFGVIKPYHHIIHRLLHTHTMIRDGLPLENIYIYVHTYGQTFAVDSIIKVLVC